MVNIVIHYKFIPFLYGYSVVDTFLEVSIKYLLIVWLYWEVMVNGYIGRSW